MKHLPATALNAGAMPIIGSASALAILIGLVVTIGSIDAEMM